MAQLEQDLVRTVLSDVPTASYIDGRVRERDQAMFTVVDPATEQPLVELSDAEPEEAVEALNASVKASKVWMGATPRQRSTLLWRVYEGILAEQEQLATLITLEMGKPLRESRAEVLYGAEFVRWFAEEAVRIEGSWMSSPVGDSRLVTMKQPVGPCLLITPWNFPLAMVTRKLAPALAAGCTVVLKPAEQAPLTALWLIRVLEQAELPAGVVNIILTTRPGQVVAPLLSDERLRKLSFTGSTTVGGHLLARAGTNVLRTSMELGGNAPFIVFEDAEIDEAVEAALVAKLRNMGESCVAANRFLVHTAVAGRFSERLAARMSSLCLGHGLDPRSEIGPLIDENQQAKVVRLVEEATASGARILTPEVEVPAQGYFVAPTVLTDIPGGAALLEEEIFGPIAPIQEFSDEPEAIALANATRSGLVAFVFTRDVRRTTRVAEALEVGMVGLNRGLVSNAAAPFGGAKHSGLGREGGRQGIEEYLELKYVALDTSLTA